MSENNLELAEVVWFSKEKRFGFARDRQGTEIFFHFNDGRFVKVEGGNPTFAGPTIEVQGRQTRLRDPLTDETILFVRSEGSQGRPKASPWCYESHFLQEFREYEAGQEPCSLCTHPMGEHAGSVRCMHDGCLCGTEEFEHEEDEPHQVWFTEPPGGHYGYE